jgi:hypothetical protein
LIQDVEPSGTNGYGGNGTISYTYYGDDTRASIAVTSSALAGGAKSLSYGYRVDGLPALIQPSWTGSANFSFSYKPSGRLSSESDPYTGQTINLYDANGGVPTVGPTSQPLVARQVTYDSYGRLASLILPEGYTYTFSTSGYDGEDEPTSYQLSNGLCTNINGTGDQTCTAATKNVTYSARGEILATTDTSNQQSADGFLCTPSSGGCAQSFDARNGMVYSANGLSYSYDAFGRNIGVTMNGKTITRGYDGDSHLTSQQNLTGSSIACLGGVTLGCDPNTNAVDAGSGATYTWGTNGHPVEYVGNLTGGSASTYWEHWDPASDNVLFESGSSIAADLAVGKLGVSNATNGITIEDRDPFGQYAAAHTGNQFTAWTQAPPASQTQWGDLSKTYFHGGIGSNLQSSDPEWASRVLLATRPDAYIDSTYGISFQGVRSADENSG